METMLKCPICGKENKRIYYTEEVGVVEYHYSCDRCGYNNEMCYSPTHQYIDLLDGKWDFDKLKEAFIGNDEFVDAESGEIIKRSDVDEY